MLAQRLQGRQQQGQCCLDALHLSRLRMGLQVLLPDLVTDQRHMCQNN